jgi:alkanesulfonate monooxygenase SsuD/methylene tetrahydromethanopterin reductase-like flavin-dependent oxidoreductase (luciferase family)
MLDDVLAFLQEWWTTTPVSWDSEFFSLPAVHADLRPVQAGGPPIWIGGTSAAAMRRVGRIGTGWLGVEGLPGSRPLVVASPPRGSGRRPRSRRAEDGHADQPRTWHGR